MASPNHDAYRILFERSPDPAWVTRDGVILLINAAAARVFGAPSPDALVGTSVLELVHPDFRELARQRLSRVVREGTGVPVIPMTFVTLTGAPIDAEIEGAFVEFDGAPAVLGAMRDIAKRIQAEDALKASEERLRMALDASSSAVWDWDLVRDLVYCSPRWYSMLGYPVLAGARDIASIRVLYHPEDGERIVSAVHKAIADGSSYEVEARMRCADGTWRWLHSRGSVTARDNEGRATRFVGINTDVNERKLAEARTAALEANLKELQKLEAIGRLAGGVAHDFNNMLSVILGHAELAVGELPADAPILPDLLEIQKAAERSAALTRQLLAFARQQVVAPTVLNLNESVSNALSMLQRLIGEDIPVAWRPSASPWPIRMDPSQLDQLLTNLCVNARDAIADVGTIVIETSNALIDEAFCARHPGARPGEYVRLTISDTGTGMDHDTMAKIFDPFFTTKEIGLGTGLGLATVYGVVNQSDGFITVNSTLGVGTAFDIYLPRHLGGFTAESPFRTATSSRGSERILLVEDEPSILRLATRVLSDLGYCVVSASGPDDALRLAAHDHEPIHLLLTDVIMPQMNGRDLSSVLHDARPQMKVLFMSGYPSDVIVTRGVLDEGVNFLQKPFTARTLAAKVRETLDRAR